MIKSKGISQMNGARIALRRIAAPVSLFALLSLLAIAAPKARAQTTCPPLTQGFWKNHTSAWKLKTLTLGTTTYTAAQAEAILETPAGGDASLILADQLIAALLSIANGTDSTPVANTIADANTLLGAGPIPEGIDPSSALGQQMVTDADILDNYNNGNVTQACGVVVPPGSCQPSSSLSVLVQGSNVTSYVPKGAWSFFATGVSVVNIEGTSITPTKVATPNVVNSCASNPMTGATVCTANNTDVYLLSGTTLGGTLTSGGSGRIGFSGGFCTNCGVAMDAVHNKAVIGLSVAGAPGFQFLNLATSTFEPAFASPSGNISEDPLLDPTRNTLGLNTTTGNPDGALLLSASESNNYEIVDVTTSTSPAFYERSIGNPGFPDSSGEDCATGIALAPGEFTSPSVVFIADLTQATYTAGSPGSWSVPATAQQNQALSESFLATAGSSGIAVAQGTHTGVVTGEFGGNTLTAIALPSTSGSGTPAITDWVTCAISGFSNGLDPHTVTAYSSPATGDAVALLANAGATTVAVVDLTMMLNPTIVPRTVGGHGCSAGTLPSTVASSVSVP
jgi:hypothetical protein